MTKKPKILSINSEKAIILINGVKMLFYSVEFINMQNRSKLNIIGKSKKTKVK